MANDKSNLERYFVTENTQVFNIKNKKYDDYKLCISSLRTNDKIIHNIEIVIANVEEVDDIIDNLQEVRDKIIRNLMEG